MYRGEEMKCTILPFAAHRPVIEPPPRLRATRSRPTSSSLCPPASGSEGRRVVFRQLPGRCTWCGRPTAPLPSRCSASPSSKRSSRPPSPTGKLIVDGVVLPARSGTPAARVPSCAGRPGGGPGRLQVARAVSRARTGPPPRPPRKVGQRPDPGEGARRSSCATSRTARCTTRCRTRAARPTRRPLSLALQALAIAQTPRHPPRPLRPPPPPLPGERPRHRRRLGSRPSSPRPASPAESFRAPHLARPGGAAAQLPGVDPHPRQPREGGQALRARPARPLPLPRPLRAVLRRGPRLAVRRLVRPGPLRPRLPRRLLRHVRGGRRPGRLGPRSPSETSPSTWRVFRQGQGAVQSHPPAMGDIYEDALYMTNLFSYLGIPTGGELPRGGRALTPGAAPRPHRARPRVLPLPGPDGVGAAGGHPDPRAGREARRSSARTVPARPRS